MVVLNSIKRTSRVCDIWGLALICHILCALPFRGRSHHGPTCGVCPQGPQPHGFLWVPPGKQSAPGRVSTAPGHRRRCPAAALTSPQTQWLRTTKRSILQIILEGSIPAWGSVAPKRRQKPSAGAKIKGSEGLFLLEGLGENVSLPFPVSRDPTFSVAFLGRPIHARQPSLRSQDHLVQPPGQRMASRGS